MNNVCIFVQLFFIFLSAAKKTKHTDQKGKLLMNLEPLISKVVTILSEEEISDRLVELELMEIVRQVPIDKVVEFKTVVQERLQS
jgi:hypothetical protein